MSVPPHRWRRRPWSLPIALAALLAFDYLLVARLNVYRTWEWSAWRLWLDTVAQTAGDGLTLTLLAAGIWTAGYVTPSRRLERAGLYLFGAIVCAGFWTHTLKTLVGRPRPRAFDVHGLWWPHGPAFPNHYDSFPSGHAMVVFALVPLLAALWPRGRTAFLVSAALIAAGRVYGGDHFPTDVLAGGLIGWQIGRYLAARWQQETTDAVA